MGKEWNLSHTSSISIKLHGSWKIKGKGLGAKHILGFTEPHIGFPNPGFGHCIHSARLWSKPFQDWNQSCGIWDPQDQSGGLWVPLHHGGMWQFHFMSVSIFMRLEIYYWGDRKRIKPVCLSCFLPSLLSCFSFPSSSSFFKMFWLCCVFFAVCGLSLAAKIWGFSSLWCMGFSLQWHLLLRSTGSRACDLSIWGTQA